MAISAAKAKILKKKVVAVKDYPMKGIGFKDITPLLADEKAFAIAVNALAEFAAPLNPEVIVSPEARGFMFGAALAHHLKCGFVPARKPHKLPRKVVSAEYSMEYGNNSLSIHEDALKPNQRVLIIDDLLASGGTAYACTELTKSLKGKLVGYGFVITLKKMQGTKRLDQSAPVFSCLTY